MSPRAVGRAPRHLRIILQLAFLFLGTLYLANRTALVSSVFDRIYRHPELRLSVGSDSPPIKLASEWRTLHTVILKNRGNDLATSVYLRILSPGEITRAEVSSQVIYEMAPSTDQEKSELAFVIERFPPTAKVSVVVWDVQRTSSAQELQVSAVWDHGAVLESSRATAEEEVEGLVAHLRVSLGRGWHTVLVRASERFKPVGYICANVLVVPEFLDAAVFTLIIIVLTWIFVPSRWGAIIAGGLIGLFSLLFIDLLLDAQLILGVLGVLFAIEIIYFALKDSRATFLMVLYIGLAVLTLFLSEGILSAGLPPALGLWPVATKIMLMIWEGHTRQA